GSFRVFLWQAQKADADRQELALAEAVSNTGNLPEAVQIRDDFNLLLLRNAAIDTTGETNLLSFNITKADAANAISNLQFKGKGGRLRLLKFAAAVRKAWLDELQETGTEILAYVPNNGYLVRETAESSGRLLRAITEAEARGETFVQWVGDFKDEYKIQPAL